MVDASASGTGAHVNAVGRVHAHHTRAAVCVVARAGVYVDTRPGAFSEAGDLLLARDETAFTLEDVRR